jgi:predicted GNAT family acetyltransferase
VNEVVNNQQARQFEIAIDGHTAFLRYAGTAGRIDLLHTEVPPQLGGRGLGGTLAKAALDYARAEHLAVIPSCPFVQKYIERNPDYAALVVRGD